MILCFDIGGTTIKVAEAHSAENVIPKERITTPANDFDGFVAVLRKAIDGAKVPPEVLAFSMAGVIDSDSGIATAANIPCLTGRRLQTEFEAIFGLPVILANDADCFALAEATIGAGRGHEVVFGLILGTGVGGGVVVRGQLINGTGGFAGELGHGPIAQRVFDDLAVTLPAFACGCGQTGCLDAICSARGIEKLHLHLHDIDLDSRAIVDGWESGDVLTTKTVEVWLAVIAPCLAVIESVLGAGVIAIGGGMSNSPRLIAALDVSVRGKCLKQFARSLVVPAQCPIEPGLVGAAILGLQHSNAISY